MPLSPRIAPRAARPEPVAWTWSTASAVLVKDALLLAAWCNGVLCRTVHWRGTRLRVMAGTRLAPVHAPARAQAPVLDTREGLFTDDLIR